MKKGSEELEEKQKLAAELGMPWNEEVARRLQNQPSNVDGRPKSSRVVTYDPGKPIEVPQVGPYRFEEDGEEESAPESEPKHNLPTPAPSPKKHTHDDEDASEEPVSLFFSK